MVISMKDIDWWQEFSKVIVFTETAISQSSEVLPRSVRMQQMDNHTEYLLTYETYFKCKN